MKVKLTSYRQYEKLVLPHLDQKLAVDSRVEYGVTMPDGGNGYRETHSQRGVDFVEIWMPYCRNRSWIYMFEGFEQKLREAHVG